MELSPTELRELTQIFILANTPSYLYRRMSESASVRSLGDRETERSLTARYRKVAAKRSRSPDEVAIAYACLMALMLKQPAPSRQLLDRLKKERMDWGESLIDLFLSRPSAVTVANIDIPPAPPVIARRTGKRRLVSSSTKTIKVK